MSDDLRISGVGFVPSSPGQQRTGLLGWITCVLNDALVLDGIALRRTQSGRLTLSFPARRDRQGADHPYYRPLSDDIRRVLEQAIIGRLVTRERVEP